MESRDVTRAALPAMPWTSRTLSTWRISSIWIILSISWGLLEHVKPNRWQARTGQGPRCNTASQHHETILFHTCWGSMKFLLQKSRWRSYIQVLSKVYVIFKAAREICLYFSTSETDVSFRNRWTISIINQWAPYLYKCNERPNQILTNCISTESRTVTESELKDYNYTCQIIHM